MGPIKLVPINSSSKEELQDRPTLELESESGILFIGDNDETGIVDPQLSHKVVKIYVKRGKIFAFSLPDGRGIAMVNGSPLQRGCRRHVKAGDIISLSGSEDDEYAYRLEGELDQLSTGDSSQGPSSIPAAAAIDISNDTITSPAALCLQKNVGEEVICAICMEILVKPRTVVPCGHSFCEECINTQAGNCPECRGPIQAHLTCLALQNMIERLVEVSRGQDAPTIFEKDDLESYAQRSGGDKAPAAVCSRKRRRAAQRAARAAEGIPYPPQQVLDLTD